jgi:hypothetical protein
VVLPDDQKTPQPDTLLAGALDTSKVIVSNPYRRIFREEQWNQLALLAVELLRVRKENELDNLPVAKKPINQDVAKKLIDQVAARLKKQEYRTVEGSPPWGYRCLDHSQRIDLAIAQSSLGEFDGRILETLQDAYFDCLYFLRSDHSFLRTWDANDSEWLPDQWNLECSSIVCSSLLSIAGLDWSTITTDSKSISKLIISESFGSWLKHY